MDFNGYLYNNYCTGHEYLEMKNIAGAVEAYRNAVEIDPKGFL